MKYMIFFIIDFYCEIHNKLKATDISFANSKTIGTDTATQGVTLFASKYKTITLMK